ncbi:MAG TPA: hypothetical protein VFV93_12115 [Thermomicrobiales bacterium]|nr:hypothetical protein [Thermomicrobiales bacterium]
MRDADQRATRENVSSPLLPGGNLISASLDRQVMIWSDRGGASRHIGDRWASRCSSALDDAIGTRWPVPLDEPFEVIHVIRLDDVPDVSREANRHHLENPDFLLIGSRPSSTRPCLQAADAKFAADRIKPSQVSATIVQNLLAVEDGVTRALVEQTLADHGLSEPEIVRGVFIAPQSELTDYLLRRVTTGKRASVDAREVVTIPPEPGAMFAGLPESRVIGGLARIDALPVTPRDNLISAIYYFRLACACFYLWSEGNRPLLGGGPISEPEPGIVAAEIATRSTAASSAYGLIDAWAVDVQPQIQARQAISDVATLPIRMGDIRQRLERAGSGEPRAVRQVRRDLDIAFRARLAELVGVIEADDPRSLTQILSDVAGASRSLAGEMQTLLDQLISQAGWAGADNRSAAS